MTTDTNANIDIIINCVIDQIKKHLKNKYPNIKILPDNITKFVIPVHSGKTENSKTLVIAYPETMLTIYFLDQEMLLSVPSFKRTRLKLANINRESISYNENYTDIICEYIERLKN